MKIWVEKTIVGGKKHRVEGDRALGKAIWSPQASSSGSDIYKNMRDVRKGDLILHLIDNSHFSGVSVVKNNEIKEVNGLEQTTWQKDCYLHELEDYIELDPVIDRTELFDSTNQESLLQILGEGEAFYTSRLDLRQGAYLTPCNLKLFDIINSIHINKTGNNLPHYDKLKFRDISNAIKAYVKHCQNTDWISDERYKWKFSDWVSSRVDLASQDDDEDVLAILIESQEQKFYENSNLKGVNFIKSGQRFSDSFITLDDIKFMRVLCSEDWDGTKPQVDHDSTYPKLSVWLTIFDPSKFKPYANNELSGGIRYLFSLDDNYPKKGFKAFIFAMNKIKELEKIIRENEDLNNLFLEQFEKEQLSDLDWAWIAQDIVLYATRVLSQKRK